MTKGLTDNGFGKGKAWSGRFRERTHRLVEAFTGSVTVDRRLYAQDIQGSIAHCKTLEKARVLTASETRTIVRALEAVKTDLLRRMKTFTWRSSAGSQS
jgi:argininosuccinate lyase